MKNSRYRKFTRSLLIAIAALSWAAPRAAYGQQQSTSTPAETASVSESLGELKSEVRELKDLVVQLQQQTSESRTEIVHLRQQLEASRTFGVSTSASAPGVDEQSGVHAADSAAQLQQQVDALAENQQLLSGKVDDQYQTKLESASKYRVRFSGIVLFNLFSNSGSVDNLDVPQWATDGSPISGSGAVGGTLRQSILGFEVFGPNLLGARTSGNVNFDFGGGFPSVYDGVNSGLMRLRTATMRLDWENTSLVAGQDQLFIAPNSPTSFASLIVPALSYSGNLWTWTPQLRVEHRFTLANDSTVSLQGGVMDPLTGQPPPLQWYRTPQAGEISRAPAIAGRVAYAHSLFGHNITLGAAGYYSRQDWGFGREVNSWAGMVDWSVPLDRWFTVSGSFYRGAAIGGLGGGVGNSVIYNGYLGNSETLVVPVNAIGGWAQLKYRPAAKLEFNVAFGQDNPFAADIRVFGDNGRSYGDPTLIRNRGGFGNLIYRPRSDLLFSLEYRRLRTFNISNSSYEAGQVNLGMGVLF